MRGDRGFLLIVEDHSPVHDPHRLMIGRGWETCLTTGPSQASALIDGGVTPDCIILLMRRPDEGGSAVLRKVRTAG